MSLCESIDTLAMAYLDGELAAEERHELEAHLCECAACRSHVDTERDEHEVVRKALTAPPAPDMLRARLVRALDAEDKVQRRRWTQYLLPGSAMCAAAAAVAVFVGVNPNSAPQVSPVAREAVRQQMRNIPLQRVADTQQFLHSNFEIDPAPSDDNLVGTALYPHGINGHDGALLVYRMNLEGRQFNAKVVAIRDVGEDEFQDGEEVRIGDRALHVIQANGETVVTYVDPRRHNAFMYFAPEISPNELVWLAGSGLLPPR
jgi:hypothetical protein